jgi:hypothetical protein
MVINEIIDCAHEFVADPGSTEPFSIPEIGCDKDIRMILDLMEINRIEYF